MNTESTNTQTEQTVQTVPPTTPEEGTPPALPPAAAPNENSDPKPFYDGYNLADEKIGYIQNKGWKGIDDMLTSYQNLEKHKGLDKNNIVELPNPEDPESVKAFHAKIGVPEKADGYDFGEMPSDLPISDDLVSWFKNTAHNLGFPKAATESLFKEYHQKIRETQQALEQNIAAESKRQLEEFKTQEGARYNESVELARRTYRSYGIEENNAKAIESIIGTAQFIKLFSDIGRGSKEADFITGNSNNGNFTMTPQQAKLKLQELMSDQKWVQGYKNKEPAKMDEFMRLNKLIVGQQ